MPTHRDDFEKQRIDSITTPLIVSLSMVAANYSRLSGNLQEDKRLPQVQFT